MKLKVTIRVVDTTVIISGTTTAASDPWWRISGNRAVADGNPHSLSDSAVMAVCSDTPNSFIKEWGQRAIGAVMFVSPRSRFKITHATTTTPPVILANQIRSLLLANGCSAAMKS
jgi:hypothetical protein